MNSLYVLVRFASYELRCLLGNYAGVSRSVPSFPVTILPGSFVGDKTGAREREAWSWCAILLVLLLDRRLDLCLLDVLHALLLVRRDGLGVLGAAGLGFDDGELFLRLDQVEDERVGAREDQGEDEARAVQVKVALCACAASFRQTSRVRWRRF